MAFPTSSAAIAKTYAGVTTLVIGSGHSAGNALLDLVKLGGDRAAHVDRLGDAGHESRAHFQRRRFRPAARRAANLART